MAKVKFTKRTIIPLVVLGAIILGFGVGYLIWRTNQDDTVAPTDSEAGSVCAVDANGTPGSQCSENEIYECGDCVDGQKVCKSHDCVGIYNDEGDQCVGYWSENPDTTQTCTTPTPTPTPTPGDSCTPNDPTNAYGCGDHICEYPEATYCDGDCQCVDWETQRDNPNQYPNGCTGSPMPADCPTGSMPADCPTGMINCGVSGDGQNKSGCSKYGDMVTWACGGCNNPSRVWRYCKSTGDDDDDDDEENYLTVSGQVYCSDDGGTTKYPIQGALIELNKDQAGQIEEMTTNSSGNFSSSNNTTEPSDGAFAVRVIDLSNASALGTDQPVSAMTPQQSVNCTRPNQCSSYTGSPQCGANGRSYEFCNLNEGSHGGFDFMLTNCTAAENPMCVNLAITNLEAPEGVDKKVEIDTNFDSAGIDYSEEELQYRIEFNCVDQDLNEVAVGIAETLYGNDSGTGPIYSFTQQENPLELEFTLPEGEDYASCSIESIPILQGTEYPSADCIGEVVIRSEPQQNPDWELEKTGVAQCIDDNTENVRARVDYVITLTNVSQVGGVINQVVDEPEDIKTAWLVNDSFVPADPTVQNSGDYVDTITWALSGDQANFDPQESMQFKYSMIIPKTDFGSYYNITTAYPEEGDNFSADEDIWAACTIPGAGLFDEVSGRIALGVILVILGLGYMSFSQFDRVVLKFYSEGQYRLSDEFKNKKKMKKVSKVREEFEEKLRKD